MEQVYTVYTKADYEQPHFICCFEDIRKAVVFRDKINNKIEKLREMWALDADWEDIEELNKEIRLIVGYEWVDTIHTADISTLEVR